MSPRRSMARQVGVVGALGLALLSLACGDDGDDGDGGDTAMDAGGETAADDDGEPETSAGMTTGAIDGPTWNSGVSEIFAQRCSGCHDWALDYELVSADTEYLSFRINNGHGELTEEEIAEVEQWIDNGTPL